MSLKSKRHMNLAAFLYADANYSRAGWRHPDAYSDAGGLNLGPWLEFARMLEDAKFDMLFMADGVSAGGVDDLETFCRTASTTGFEPLTLLSALSQVTSRLGLGATVVTTWTEPYNTARMLASLDRISKGRAAWNVVTGRTPEVAQNFSKGHHFEHADRYEMAEEFVDVCLGLWNSYEAGAFLLDKESGQYVDPSKLHLTNHKGKFYSVKGPLNVPGSIQGRPVIIQAGQSEPAKELSARVADCVFTMQAMLDGAREFYSDIKGKVSKYGRSPESLRVLPGVSVYVGRSREEANEKFDYLQSLTPVDFAVKQLGTLLGGMNFLDQPLDGPIPPLVPNAAFVDPEHLAKPYREKNFTLRQFALRMAATKSHLTLIGNAEDIADQLEHWFRSEAADGFILLPPYVPGCLTDFIDLVLPELRRRDLFRVDYSGTTLRENLLGNAGSEAQ